LKIFAWITADSRGCLQRTIGVTPRHCARNGGSIMNGSFDHTELCGAIHLHTTFSDGGVTYPVLIEAAREVGLDYIVVTDHASLAGREAGYEGFFGNLFVCVGYEHNDVANLNHYLALGCDTVVTFHDTPQGYVDRIKAQGGIGFIAHPIEVRHYFEKYPPYPWTDWNVSGFDGLELWNQMSDWLENLKSPLHFVKLFYPRRFLLEVKRELLERWDALNRTRFVSGIGGVDAHTMEMKFGPFGLTIFPIKVELKGIRTHVYVDRPLPAGDAPGAKAMLLSALKNGNGFVSNFRRGDAKATRIFLLDKQGRAFSPGLCATVPELPARLCVSVPDKSEVRLIRNGQRCAVCTGRQAEFPVTSDGIYRIEVFKGKYAWIYSNPFPVGRYPL
jgi:hypothetical protein